MGGDRLDPAVVVTHTSEAVTPSAAIVAVGAGLALLALAGIGLLVVGMRRQPPVP